jgi:hypothetical protein
MSIHFELPAQRAVGEVVRYVSPYHLRETRAILHLMILSTLQTPHHPTVT